ncbi:PE-PPE domain-containing protein [Gordonia amicalis]|uniref:PE-PPE domain-containing protein n=1 Tax=Gordonia amicalis TaxID=89053 RepID=UPI0002A6401C|nr:PE-PPE domain-containing protein [Gordonia amicalis]MBA5849676.1 PE-PPE domain-containing protein [Gordonia amicalis]MDV7173837.1 PE-PPE domain-containing protein [Gordonia amicalis]NKX76792.1 PE-PPE domain-containing protein [Gordonia amicalis]UKO90844.1 PE-PPE domain-containing protein [Gordonia amicalis]UOG22355.1 PE-PPE domain-containing protein [Gordonia amicalis]
MDGVYSDDQTRDHVVDDAAPAGITVFVVGGTGESYPGDVRTEVTGLLSAVTDELDERFDSRWVAYPASYGPAPHPGGMSFADSVAIGARRLSGLLERTAGPVALLGYSQGAVVIRAALAGLWTRGDPVVTRLLGVGLVADPHQPPGAVPGCDGWGVAGPGAELPPGLPVMWVGAPDDVICNARADSLVRDFADLTRAMTFAALGRWGCNAWEVLRRNAFQNARRTAVRPSQWRRDVHRLASAWWEIRCYLPSMMRILGIVLTNSPGGRHTSYQYEPYRRGSVTDPASTGCQVIAGWLQVQATFADEVPAVSPGPVRAA